MGSRSPKSNQFLFMSQRYSCAGLVKIYPFLHEIGCRQATLFKNLSPCVTIKMGQRSPKSYQFFSMSQQYRCTGLVKIHLFILEIGCRKAIFKQSEIPVTLKMGSRSLKSNQFLSLSIIKLHKFGQNPSIHFGDMVQKRHFLTI